jgi:hypothetical protein
MMVLMPVMFLAPLVWMLMLYRRVGKLERLVRETKAGT